MKDLLDKGLIQEILSPCVVTTVLILNKDGGCRMCPNFAALNKITIKYCFPLPHIHDFIYCLSGASWFSKLDLKRGYH